MIGTTTLPQRPANASVLVVHDALNTMTSVLDALREEFDVREAGDALETLEAISTKRYACIVCRASDAIGVQPFARLVEDATLVSRPPIVYVVGTDITTTDLAYLKERGAHWLAERAGAGEIACLVRAAASDTSAEQSHEQRSR